MPFLSRTLTRVTVSCPVAAKEKYRTSGGAVPRARLSCTNRARKSSCGLWIGFLNDLFYGRSHIAGPAEVSIPFLLDEKPTVVRGGCGESGREVREISFIQLLARTQSDQHRRLALEAVFGFSGRLN